LLCVIVQDRELLIDLPEKIFATHFLPDVKGHLGENFLSKFVTDFAIALVSSFAFKTDQSKTCTPEMAGNYGTDYFARFVF
jgi:hypothetical protein